MTITCFRNLLLVASLIFAAMTTFSATPKAPDSRAEIVCSYAPSQSKSIAGITGAAGGAAATTAGIGGLLGLSVVTHSSGALILSGSGGYIAGTLGLAVAAPAVISVGAIVGGVAVTVELLCAPKNHPDGYKNVVDAAREFQNRTGNWVNDAKVGLASAGTKAAVFSGVSISAMKGKADSLYLWVFRK